MGLYDGFVGPDAGFQHPPLGLGLAGASSHTRV